MKKILSLLIPYYKKCIEEIQKMYNIDNILDYLENNNINRGICHCANHTFDTDIYSADWVLTKIDRANNPDYWDIPVENYETKTEMINSLQKRVDIMESLLNSPE